MRPGWTLGSTTLRCGGASGCASRGQSAAHAQCCGQTSCREKAVHAAVPHAHPLATRMRDQLQADVLLPASAV